MIKPNAIVIGGMKCGSSTVCTFLEDHPEAYMLPAHEPNYFCDDDIFAKGDAWYLSLFNSYEGQQVCCEGSNRYTSLEFATKSAERMSAYAPDLRLVYIVRHPIDRAVSEWVQQRAQGNRISADLDNAILEVPAFIGKSQYWSILKPYRKFFSDNQIHIGFLEDMKSDPTDFFRRICHHFEISPRLPDRAHVNPSEGKKLPVAGLDRLRNAPGFELAKKLAPSQLRQHVKERFFKKRMTAKPELSPGVRAALTSRLRPEAEALLAHCGKPSNFWAFDD